MMDQEKELDQNNLKVNVVVVFLLQILTKKTLVIIVLQLVKI